MATLTKAQHISTLYFNLDYLEVDKKGEKCDSQLYPYSLCDPMIEICASQSTHSRCDRLFMKSSPNDYSNTHSIAFNGRFGDRPLPIKILVKSLENLSLTLNVHDADVISSPENIGSLHIDMSRLIKSGEDLSNILKNGDGSLTLNYSLWTNCDTEYYGSLCVKRCVPANDHINGHYGCEMETGNKLCIAGWSGENCTDKDVCTQHRPCAFTGRCINTDTFHCECKEGFSGTLCNVPDYPCKDSKRSSSSSSSNDHVCNNNGVCILRRDNTSQAYINHCVCKEGFLGANCEHDVNECAQWAQLPNSVKCLTPGHGQARPCCGPEAVCRNKYGTYECICPLGWTGLHCEFPPALWPDGFQPITNQSNWSRDHRQRMSSNESVLEPLVIHSATSPVLVTVMSIFLLLLLILIIAGMYVFWRYRRRQVRNERIIQYMATTGMLLNSGPPSVYYSPSTLRDPIYQLPPSTKASPSHTQQLMLPAPPVVPLRAFENNIYELNDDARPTEIYEELSAVAKSLELDNDHDVRREFHRSSSPVFTAEAAAGESIYDPLLVFDDDDDHRRESPSPTLRKG